MKTWKNVEGWISVEMDVEKGNVVTLDGDRVPELDGVLTNEANDYEMVIYFLSSGVYYPAVLWPIEKSQPAEWSEQRCLKCVEVSEWHDGKQIAVHKLDSELGKILFDKYEKTILEEEIELQNHDDYDDDRF